MRTRAGLVVSAFALASLLGVACAGKKPPPKEPAVTETVADAGPEDAAPPEPPKPKSLFERLGGKEGIAKIADTFFKNANADAKLTKRFAALKGPKGDKFKQNLADHLCVETGGPETGAECKPEGKFMQEVSKTKLKEEEWQAVLLGLKNALEEQKIGETEQGDLAATVSKFHDDLVDVKKKK